MKSSIIQLALIVTAVATVVGMACGGGEQPAPAQPTAAPQAAAPAPAAQPTAAPTAMPAPTSAPAMGSAPAMASEQSGNLVWCCVLGHPNDVPSYVPFYTAVSDHYGSKEPLLWRERSPIPQIGALQMDQSLAESWEVESDQSKITFKIRQGVPFHKDWGDVTAADVVWSFNNAREEGNTNPRSGFWGEYTDRWELIDDNTAVMHVQGQLSVRWSVELSNQWRGTGSVQSKRAYDELGEEEANLTFAGTGPFEVMKWVPDEVLEAEALPTHYREAAKVQSFEVRVIPETASQIAAFETGEVHMAPIPNQFLKEVLSDTGGSRQRVGLGNSVFVAFGGNYWAETARATGETVFPREGFKPDDAHPWIGDPRDDAHMERARKVRQAMAMGIDRDLISEAIEQGLAPPHYTFIGFTEDEPQWEDSWLIPYDPAGAIELLAEAGYPDGFTTDFWSTPGGATQEIAEAIAQMWGDIGLDVELEVTAYGARRPTLIARNISIPYMSGNAVGDHTDPQGRLISPELGGANRGIEIPNDILDKFYYPSLSEPSEDTRIANNAAIQDYLSQWMLNSPLVLRLNFIAVRPEVAEWTPYTDTFGVLNSPETVVLK